MENFSRLSEPVQTLYTKGKLGLSNRMLISAITGISEDNLSAFMQAISHDLNNIPKISLDVMAKIPYMTPRKATAVIAAFELARRRTLLESPVRKKIYSSKDVYDHMKNYMMDLDVEHFYVIILSRNSDILKTIKTAEGGVSAVLVDPKIIFKHAINTFAAASMILVHNHPSGNTKPSDHDLAITKRMVKVGEELEMHVLDHMIFTEHAYLSFSDEGLL
jgi:DNA repair protein RadC